MSTESAVGNEAPEGNSVTTKTTPGKNGKVSQSPRQTGRWPQILRAAAELFREKGYAGTSVQDIVSRVGMSNKASLYYYVASKEDLLWEVIGGDAPRLLEHVERDILPARGNSADRLSAFIDFWMRWQAENNRTIGMIPRDLHGLSASRRALATSVIENHYSFLARIIEDGIAEKRFAADVDPRMAAKAIFSLINGTWDWNAGGDSEPLETVIASHVRFSLRGLGDESDAL